MNFLIPVHNEELALPKLLRLIFDLFPSANVCLVDSLCTDQSIDLAKVYPVHICRAQKLGYAQALSCGYAFILEKGWDDVIQLDSMKFSSLSMNFQFFLVF